MIKPAIALCLSLVVPFSISVADDEQTETLHNNTYQEGPTSTGCSPSACAVTFPPTQHINTAVTNINCYFVVSAGAQVGVAELYTQNTFLSVSVPVNFLGNNGSSSTALVINAQVNYFIKQGDIPVVLVSLYSGTMSNFKCVISGYHS